MQLEVAVRSRANSTSLLRNQSDGPGMTHLLVISLSPPSHARDTEQHSTGKTATPMEPFALKRVEPPSPKCHAS